MRILIILLTFFVLGVSSLCLAEDFTAQVDHNSVGLNESINLKLELSGTQATTEPNLSELDGSFQVIGQQQSSIQRIINGKSSSSTIWNYTLMPTRSGHVLIPSIVINTAHGDLKTQTITIDVGQGAPAQPIARARNGISFVGKANKTKLYKNEPVFISYKLTSTKSLNNVQLGTLDIKDAIVEPQDQPKMKTELVNGQEQVVLRASYIVTPLKDGILIIPPLVIRGESLAPQPANSIGQSDPFFDNADDDPFASMQKMMQRFSQNMNAFDGFANYKPITLASKPITLTVLPPVAGMTPWLPTTNLKLSETWNSAQPQVGEPITRIITTEATGLAASELPGFADQLNSNNEYKVYSDRPVTSTKVTQSQIIGRRVDTFTIIPQAGGDIHFPEIKLSWWDSLNRSKKVAILPERTIHVTGGIKNLAAAASPVKNDTSGPSQIPPTVSSPPAQSSPSSSTSYKGLIIGGLLGIISFLVLFIIRESYLVKNRKTISSTPPVEPLLSDSANMPNVISPIRKEDLKNCKSVGEIHQFLQKYSHVYWGVPVNSSLSKIFATAAAKLENFDLQKAKNITVKIEGALYANTTVNLEQLQHETAELVFQKNIIATKPKTQEELSPLNPIII